MLTYLLFSFLSIYSLWLFFLAVMNLKRAKDAGSISKIALYLGYPILFVGYFIDFVTNVFVLTIFLFDLPKELTVTARLKRYKAEGSGWRYNFSAWFATNLLDTFDPSGKHV